MPKVKSSKAPPPQKRSLKPSKKALARGMKRFLEMKKTPQVFIVILSRNAASAEPLKKNGGRTYSNRRFACHQLFGHIFLHRTLQQSPVNHFQTPGDFARVGILVSLLLNLLYECS